MRGWAIRIAVVGLFVLAGVGRLCGVPVGVCAQRAALGAVALYVMTTLAGRVLLSILADAAVRRDPEKEPAGEHPDP